MAYHSSYTGPQIDQAVGNALNKDSSTLSNDVNHIPASSVVKSAISAVSDVSEISLEYKNGASAVSGGAYRIGKLIVIAIRFELSNSVNGQVVFTGLPEPARTGSYGNAYVRMIGATGSGTFAVNENGECLAYSANAGIIIINGCYIARV